MAQTPRCSSTWLCTSDLPSPATGLPCPTNPEGVRPTALRLTLSGDLPFSARTNSRLPRCPPLVSLSSFTTFVTLYLRKTRSSQHCVEKALDTATSNSRAMGASRPFHTAHRQFRCRQRTPRSVYPARQSARKTVEIRHPGANRTVCPSRRNVLATCEAAWIGDLRHAMPGSCYFTCSPGLYPRHSRVYWLPA